MRQQHVPKLAPRASNGTPISVAFASKQAAGNDLSLSHNDYVRWGLDPIRHKPPAGALKPSVGLRQVSSQKRFLCLMVGPDSSYSLFEIHICWKVLNDDKMEPPIHTEYLRSGGATTLIFIVDGAKAVSSFVIRSPIPANMVVPPESTTFEYKSLRISTSHFIIPM